MTTLTGLQSLWVLLRTVFRAFIIGLLGTTFFPVQRSGLTAETETEPGLSAELQKGLYLSCRQYMEALELIGMQYGPEVEIFHEYNLPSKFNLRLANAINPSLAKVVEIEYFVPVYKNGQYSPWFAALPETHRKKVISDIIYKPGHRLSFQLLEKKFYTTVDMQYLSFLDLKDAVNFEDFENKVKTYGVIATKIGLKEEVKEPEALAGLVELSFRDVAKKYGIIYSMLKEKKIDGYELITWEPKRQMVPVFDFTKAGCKFDLKADSKISDLLKAKIFIEQSIGKMKEFSK